MVAIYRTGILQHLNTRPYSDTDIFGKAEMESPILMLLPLTITYFDEWQINDRCQEVLKNWIASKDFFGQNSDALDNTLTHKCKTSCLR